jgi:PD-(D/E)XK nuclease superfamily
VRIRLSASQVATADNCRRQLWYRNIRKVRVLALPANLAFGKCIDMAAREYVQALTLDRVTPDPVTRFLELWSRSREHSVLSYASTQCPEDFEAMGVSLMRQWPDDWEGSGFQVALDAEGNPLLDLPLRVDLGRRGDIEVELYGVLDLAVYARTAELAIIDMKSAVSAHTILHAHQSDQLTSYQLLLQANRHRLGLPTVGKLGFWDFLKRKKSSEVAEPVLVDVRGREQLREFRDKLFWLAQDIAQGRFPKYSRMQFNSPCELCDFKQHCTYGDEEGLIFPPERDLAAR